MDAKRLQLLGAFAAGCLATLALVGSRFSDGEDRPNAVVARVVTAPPALAANLEDEADGSALVAAPAKAASSATLDDDAKTESGRSVAEVLGRLEAAYREELGRAQGGREEVAVAPAEPERSASETAAAVAPPVMAPAAIAPAASVEDDGELAERKSTQAVRRRQHQIGVDQHRGAERSGGLLGEAHGIARAREVADGRGSLRDATVGVEQRPRDERGRDRSHATRAVGRFVHLHASIVVVDDSLSVSRAVRRVVHAASDEREPRTERAEYAFHAQRLLRFKVPALSIAQTRLRPAPPQAMPRLPLTRVPLIPVHVASSGALEAGGPETPRCSFHM